MAGPCASMLVALAGQELAIVVQLGPMILVPVELLAALVVPALQLALVALAALVALVGPLVVAAVALHRSLGCLSVALLASVFLRSPVVAADLAASLPDLPPRNKRRKGHEKSIEKQEQNRKKRFKTIPEPPSNSKHYCKHDSKHDCILTTVKAIASSIVWHDDITGQDWSESSKDRPFCNISDHILYIYNYI